MWVGVITQLRKQPMTVPNDDEAVDSADRMPAGPYDVWLKVKWAWSGRDLATLIKSMYVSESMLPMVCSSQPQICQ